MKIGDLVQTKYLDRKSEHQRIWTAGRFKSNLKYGIIINIFESSSSLFSSNSFYATVLWNTTELGNCRIKFLQVINESG
tara:strand:+ start:736 stop:972 length:237 start_codon:yes stop_codon:yes gene_type:complete